MDFSYNLPTFVVIEHEVMKTPIKTEFEHQPSSCENCNYLGHSMISCKFINKSVRPAKRKVKFAQKNMHTGLSTTTGL